MKDIFDKCNMGNLELNSRIIRTGLWESQITKQGQLESSVYDRYEKIASSGVGLITTELLSMFAKDSFNDYTYKIYNKNFVFDYKKITQISHKYNVPILAQLGFAKYNRQIDYNIQVNDLTIDDIRRIQTELIMDAKKLSFTGFDGVQLALGNNFFLSKFINPYFNQRKDDYGGDTFNRLKLVLEAIKVIKDNFKLHINARINAYDGRKGGITQQESIKMCKLLQEYGCDSLQVTRPLSPLYFTHESKENKLIEFTQQLNENVDIPVIVGGGFTNRDEINKLLNDTNIEYISMYRPFVAEGDFLNNWRQNQNIESRCKMCNNCYRTKTSTCYHFK